MPVTKNPPGPYKATGDRIREARLRAELSQERLAAMVPMHRIHLINLEHGRHKPTEETLRAIAEATDTPLDELAGDDGEDPG